MHQSSNCERELPVSGSLFTEIKNRCVPEMLFVEDSTLFRLYYTYPDDSESSVLTAEESREDLLYHRLKLETVDLQGSVVKSISCYHESVLLFTHVANIIVRTAFGAFHLLSVYDKHERFLFPRIGEEFSIAKTTREFLVQKPFLIELREAPLELAETCDIYPRCYYPKGSFFRAGKYGSKVFFTHDAIGFSGFWNIVIYFTGEPIIGDYFIENDAEVKGCRLKAPSLNSEITEIVKFTVVERLISAEFKLRETSLVVQVDNFCNRTTLTILEKKHKLVVETSSKGDALSVKTESTCNAFESRKSARNA